MMFYMYSGKVKSRPDADAIVFVNPYDGGTIPSAEQALSSASSGEQWDGEPKLSEGWPMEDKGPEWNKLLGTSCTLVFTTPARPRGQD